MLKKILIWGSVLTGVFVGGYYLYQYFKNKQTEASEDVETNDPNILSNKECRQLCQDLCGDKPLLFGGRQKCQRNCKDDCKAGKDVTVLY